MNGQMAQLATSFRNTGNVIFGMGNEPQNTTNSQMASYVTALNSGIATIRTIESRDSAPYPHVIMVEGPGNYSRDSKYWLTTANRPTDPVAGTYGAQLCYEHHVYDQESSWGTSGSVLDWQNPAASVPMVIGEVGIDTTADVGMVVSGQTNQFTDFVTYCKAHNIPFSAWIFTDSDGYGNTPNGSAVSATNHNISANSLPMLAYNHTSVPYTTAANGYQWTPWGYAFIQAVRTALNLGPVDASGNSAASWISNPLKITS